MVFELVCGVKKLHIYEEESVLSAMLHNPQILPERQKSGLIYSMTFDNHRDYYLKTIGNDLPIAKVFSGRFHNYQEDLTQAIIAGAFHLAENEFELFLPNDLYVFAPNLRKTKYDGKQEIYSMDDASDVIKSYMVLVDTN
tara:strand:- start:37495 stop:37914 length:420 start_codon:yes stop_codon:yes gene_type:complete